MGLSKEQVKDHISTVEKQLSEEEKKYHGYEFAKLCFQVKDYKNAIRYLSVYLTVEQKNYRAEKWMGRIYESVGDILKAVIHYERSLDIKRDQRDVIIKVAELYLSFDEPPITPLKKYLSAVEKISDAHPLVFLLTRANFCDPVPCIRMVNHYAKLGDLKQAFQCCELLNKRKELMDSVAWQDCFLQVSEKFYELLQKSGDNSYLVVDSLIAILKCTGVKFRLHFKEHMKPLGLSSFGVHSTEMLGLVLKFDQILYGTHKLLRSMLPKLSPVYMVVRELCGHLYMITAQYLYLKAVYTCNCIKTPKSASEIQLGDLCMLASLNATSPNSETLWIKPLSSELVAEEWRSTSCARLSLVVWQLMLVMRKDYLKDTIEQVKKKEYKFCLIKSLFQTNSELKVPFGSSFIQYNLQQSIFSADDSFSNVRLRLPNSDDLSTYDKEYVLDCKLDVSRLLWLCLAHKAMEKEPPISDWLEIMFPGLSLTTFDPSLNDADSFCRCDLEAYLVLLSHKYQHLFGTHWSGDQRDLSEALTKRSPYCMGLSKSELNWWTDVTKYHFSKDGLSMLEGRSQKMVVQDCLGSIRACSPLKLDIDQLAVLARHFEARAMLKLSGHYWTVVSDLVHSHPNQIIRMKKGKVNGGNKPMLLSTDVKKGEKTELERDALLAEAQLALANVALYNDDVTQALQHLSRTKTPQAAWNQSQIYIMMAEEESIESHARITYLEKASHILSDAIKKFGSSDLDLRDKFCDKLEEVKESLDNFIMGHEEEEEISPIPQLYSTPAPVINYDYSPEKIIKLNLNESVTEALNEKDKKIADISQQLEEMQAELKELKKNVSFNSTVNDSNKSLNQPQTYQTSPGGFVSSTVNMPFLNRSAANFMPSIPLPNLSGLPLPVNTSFQPGPPFPVMSPSVAVSSPSHSLNSITSSNGSLFPLNTTSAVEHVQPFNATGYSPSVFSSSKEPASGVSIKPFTQPPFLSDFNFSFGTSGSLSLPQTSKAFSFGTSETDFSTTTPKSILSSKSPFQLDIPSQSVVTSSGKYESGSINTFGTSAFGIFLPNTGCATATGVLSSAATGLTPSVVAPKSNILPLFNTSLSTSGISSSSPFTQTIVSTVKTTGKTESGTSGIFSSSPFSQTIVSTVKTTGKTESGSLSTSGISSSSPFSQTIVTTTGKTESGGLSTSGIFSSSPFSLTIVKTTGKTESGGLSSSGIFSSSPFSQTIVSTATTGKTESGGLSSSGIFSSSPFSQTIVSTATTGKTESGGLSSSGIFSSSPFSLTIVKTTGKTESGGLSSSGIFSSSPFSQTIVSTATTGKTESGGLSSSGIFLSSPFSQTIVSTATTGKTESGGLSSSGIFSSSPFSQTIVSTATTGKTESGGLSSSGIFSSSPFSQTIVSTATTGKTELFLASKSASSRDSPQFLTSSVALSTLFTSPAQSFSSLPKLSFDFQGSAKSSAASSDGVSAEKSLFMPSVSLRVSTSITASNNGSPFSAFGTLPPFTSSSPFASPLMDNSASLSSESFNNAPILSSLLNAPIQLVSLGNSSRRNSPDDKILEELTICEAPNRSLCHPLSSSSLGDHSLQFPLNADHPGLISPLHFPLQSKDPSDSKSLPVESTVLSSSNVSYENVSSYEAKSLEYCSDDGLPPPLEGNDDVLVDDDEESDDDSVIFLYEELPEPELRAKAEYFKLPQHFYLYEKKIRCSGCRGCDEEDSLIQHNNEDAPASKGESSGESSASPVDTKDTFETSKMISISPKNSSPSSPVVLTETTDMNAHTKGSQFSSLGMFSFSDMIPQSADSFANFNKAEGFQFQGTGNQLFSSTKGIEENDNPEDEADIRFEPIVSLPESYKSRSWDDAADVLFLHRSKLFRFDNKTELWKERGVGDIKIMKHRETSKVRVIMRRDQILKLCCNHSITEDMKLMPGSNEKSWIWFTQCDYSEELPKEEKMAVRFKHVGVANKFKEIFDKCVYEQQNSKKDVPSSPYRLPVQKSVSNNTWECESCMVINASEVSICLACKAPKAGPPTSATLVGSSSPPDDKSSGIEEPPDDKSPGIEEPPDDKSYGIEEPWNDKSYGIEEPHKSPEIEEPPNKSYGIEEPHKSSRMEEPLDDKSPGIKESPDDKSFGMEEPPDDNSPGIKELFNDKSSGIEEPHKSPEIEEPLAPEIKEPPDDKSPGIEEPLNDKSSGIKEPHKSSGMEESPDDKSPGMEEPPDDNSPGVEEPLNDKSSGMEEPPDDKSPGIEEPLNDKSSGIEEPYKSAEIEEPPGDKSPGIEEPPYDKSPGMEEPPDDNSPGIEEPLNDKSSGIEEPHKSSGMEEPPDDNSPGIEEPLNDKSSGIEEPYKSAEIEEPPGDKSPGMEEPPDDKSPGMEEPPDDNSPGIEEPLNDKSSGIEEPHKSSGMEEPPDDKSPGMEEPPDDKSPGIEEPLNDKSSGIEEPYKSAEIEEPPDDKSPGMEEPHKSPGMEEPPDDKSPGMEEPLNDKSSGIEEPHKSSGIEEPQKSSGIEEPHKSSGMEEPPDDKSPGMEEPPDDKSPGIEEPLNDKSAEIEEPPDDKSPGIEEPPNDKSSGIEQPHKSSGMEEPLDDKSPGMEEPPDDKSPGIEEPLNDKSSGIEKPYKSAEIGEPPGDKSPGIEEPPDDKSPGIEEPPDDNSPGIEELLNDKSSGIEEPHKSSGMEEPPEEPPDDNSPGIEEPLNDKSSGMEEPHKSSGMEEPPDDKSPGMEEPPDDNSPGIEEPLNDKSSGIEEPHKSSGMEEPPDDKSPGMEEPPDDKSPGIEEPLNPLNDKSSGIEEPYKSVEIEEPPDDKSPGMEEPLNDKSSGIGELHKSSGMEEPPDDKSPGMEEPPDDKSPGIEEPLNDKSPEIEEPPDDKSPGIEEPPNDKSSGIEEPHKSSGMEEPLDDKSPGMEEPPDDKSPGIEEPLNDKSSGIEKQYKSAEIEEPSDDKSSGIEEPPNDKSSGIEKPPDDKSFGIEELVPYLDTGLPSLEQIMNDSDIKLPIQNLDNEIVDSVKPLTGYKICSDTTGPQDSNQESDQSKCMSDRTDSEELSSK